MQQPSLIPIPDELAHLIPEPITWEWIPENQNQVDNLKSRWDANFDPETGVKLE